jgi:3-hydroxy acid dehydrogenase / malonic semialdehyde reductase
MNADISTPVLVTGATGGIGEAIVERLVQAGAQVVAVGTREEALQRLSTNTGCQTLKIDLADPAAVHDALSEKVFSGVIHCAGVLGPQVKIFETSPETVDKLVSLNIVGTINLIRSTLPQMLSSRAGTLIFLGSICGDTPGVGPGLYSACKAAMKSIASNLRFDLRGEPIRVSEVRLGRVKTGIHDQLHLDADFYNGYDCVLPADVAETVLHILSAPPAVDLSVVEMMPTLQVVGGTYFHKSED